MTTILRPFEFRQRIMRVMHKGVEPHSDKAYIAWFNAHKITELYQSDYQRGLDICKMLAEDEQELGIVLPKIPWWQRVKFLKTVRR